MSMFCFQCEQAAKETGCTNHGTCGKNPDTAALQDLLVHAAKGVSQYAHRSRQLDASDRDVDVFVLESLFMTMSNVNFDEEHIARQIVLGRQIRDRAKAAYESACARNGRNPEILKGPATLEPAADDLHALILQGEAVNIENRIRSLGGDIAGLQELLTYGLKGMSAYAVHALKLGAEDDSVYAFVHEAMDYLTRDNPAVDRLLELNMKCGEINLLVMELLDRGHNQAFGAPRPTQVRVTPVKGKALLVSGHDLHDLKEILEQTEGKGINVYTHGEMLPAHGYPELRKFSHLVGNYGGAWQEQRNEFDHFPGAILMTTNCLVEPRNSYKARIFTTNVVGFPGVEHVSPPDFAPVIQAALEAEGFREDGPEKSITVGFGHAAVLGVADKVIEAVKSGAIRRFFLIGGCDGAKTGRNYFTEMAQAVPDDCVILTLACGKYRFNKLEFGDIGGIPRLLDIGQCNDAYSAVKIASALADAFGTDVNSLPLSLIISWYEQKAVAVLLTLLHLGIRNIRLGPTLPAFLTPNLLQVLSSRFNLMATTSVDRDMKAIFAAN